MIPPSTWGAPIATLGLIMGLTLFLLGWIDAPAPPEPEGLPPIAAGELLYVGIESNLSAIGEVIEQAPEVVEGQIQIVPVHGARATLLEQVRSGEIDGALVYQKPAASDLWTLPIVLDSLTFIGHQELNGVPLTRSQLQQILTGGIGDWGAVNGSDAAIQVYVLDTQSGLHALLNSRVLENQALGSSVEVIAQPDQMLQSVAETVGALGYLPTSAYDPQAAVVPLPIDGLLAQSNTVQSQTYPFTVPVYLVASSEPTGELRALAAFFQSAEGVQNLSQQFVPLPPNQ